MLNIIHSLGWSHLQSQWAVQLRLNEIKIVMVSSRTVLQAVAEWIFEIDKHIKKTATKF